MEREYAGLNQGTIHRVNMSVAQMRRVMREEASNSLLRLRIKRVLDAEVQREHPIIIGTVVVASLDGKDISGPRVFLGRDENGRPVVRNNLTDELTVFSVLVKLRHVTV